MGEVDQTATKLICKTKSLPCDRDRSVARTLAANQVMVHQWVDTSVGDTFWVQASSLSVASAGSVVRNVANVEIVP